MKSLARAVDVVSAMKAEQEIEVEPPKESKNREGHNT
jgi:hypothetical protein